MAESKTIQDVTVTNKDKTPEPVAPIIVKHQTSNTQAEPDVQAGEESIVVRTVSNTGATVEPPSESNPVSVQEPEIKDEVKETSQEPVTEIAEAPIEEPKDPEIAVKDHSASPYEAVDALPTKAAQDVTTATDAMQQPRVYDTKEYFVPIHDTSHKHGYMVGTIIAGIITAIIAVAAVVFWATQI